MTLLLGGRVLAILAVDAGALASVEISMALSTHGRSIFTLFGGAVAEGIHGNAPF